MRKGLVITAVVLLLLAVVFGGGNALVQRRIEQEMTKRLQQSVRPFISNPENLTVENTKDAQIGRGTVRLPEVEVTGSDLQLPHDIEAKAAHIVVRDVTVDTKTKTVASVGEGRYEVTLSAEDLTRLLHQQREVEVQGLLVEPQTLSVTLSRQDGITLAGEGSEEASSGRLPFTLRGRLAPGADGKLVFQVAEGTRGGVAFTGTAGEAYALPFDTPLPPQLEGGRVREVVIDDGAITFKGSFDGSKLLPGQ